jgi:hypothetical protein
MGYGLPATSCPHHHAKIMTIFALLNIKDLAIGFKICRLGYCSGLGGLNRREERLIED